MAGGVGPGEGRLRQPWKWTWAVEQEFGSGFRMPRAWSQRGEEVWPGPADSSLWEAVAEESCGASDLQGQGGDPSCSGYENTAQNCTNQYGSHEPHGAVFLSIHSNEMTFKFSLSVALATFQELNTHVAHES